MKKFENYLNENTEESVVKKVNYTTTHLLGAVGREVSIDLEQMLDDQPHNNGHLYKFRLENDMTYPHLQQYFLDFGFEIGDTIFIHSEW